MYKNDDFMEVRYDTPVAPGLIALCYLPTILIVFGFIVVSISALIQWTPQALSSSFLLRRLTLT